jgi:hypothetical protein
MAVKQKNNEMDTFHTQYNNATFADLVDVVLYVRAAYFWPCGCYLGPCTARSLGWQKKSCPFWRSRAPRACKEFLVESLLLSHFRVLVCEECGFCKQPSLRVAKCLISLRKYNVVLPVASQQMMKVGADKKRFDFLCQSATDYCPL